MLQGHLGDASGEVDRREDLVAGLVRDNVRVA